MELLRLLQKRALAICENTPELFSDLAFRYATNRRRRSCCRFSELILSWFFFHVLRIGFAPRAGSKEKYWHLGNGAGPSENHSGHQGEIDPLPARQVVWLKMILVPKGAFKPSLAFWHINYNALGMKTFRTLDLAVEFYSLVENLKLPRHLKDQLLRASSSIPLNLAEGNAKFSYRDKKRIYQIAMGSLREAQTILKLAKISDPKIIKTADHLGASISKLLKRSPLLSE